MSNTLRGMALAAYGLLIGMHFAHAGGIACKIGNCGPVPSVPEPGTLALLATGIGVLALVRFRKRK